MNEKISTTWQEKLVLPGGVMVIDDIIEHSNLFVLSFSPQTSTVIDTLMAVDSAGEEIDFKATRNIANLEPCGYPIIAPDNWYFSKIKLTSGSIVCGKYK